MSTSEHEREREDEGSNRLEKNRYFYGKLMTPRDMQAEQRYHERRQDALARLVTGTGVVQGLDVTEIRERDEKIEITVGPGAAIDGTGRLVLVSESESREVERPSGDRIDVFLEHDDRKEEEVPKPDLGSADRVECEYNRSVETFELTIEESVASPGDSDTGRLHKPVPSVDLPERANLSSDGTEVRDDDPELGSAARSFEPAGSVTGDVTDPRVYLGTFVRVDDETWHREAVSERRPLVYTNDMLYAALVRHVVDFENPHEITPEQFGLSEDIVDRLRSFEEFRTTVEGLAGRLESLEHYAIDKSLEYMARSFLVVGLEFENKTAGTIAERTQGLIKEESSIGPSEYRTFVEAQIEQETELLAELRQSVKGESLDRYEDALDELRDVLETSDDIVSVVNAQDRVSEAADWFERAGERLARLGEEWKSVPLSLGHLVENGG